MWQSDEAFGELLSENIDNYVGPSNLFNEIEMLTEVSTNLDVENGQYSSSSSSLEHWSMKEGPKSNITPEVVSFSVVPSPKDVSPPNPINFNDSLVHYLPNGSLSEAITPPFIISDNTVSIG